MKYETYGCPIRYGLAIFGDKWTLLIIRDLMFKQRQYFGEFLKSGEGISTSVLADRLERLESQNIITKTNDKEHGKKIIYTLTEKGRDLIKVMLAIIDWSEKYDQYSEVPEDFIKVLRNNRESLIKDILQKL